MFDFPNDACVRIKTIGSRYYGDIGFVEKKALNLDNEPWYRIYLVYRGQTLEVAESDLELVTINAQVLKARGEMAKYKEIAQTFQRQRQLPKIFGLPSIVKMVKVELTLCVLSKCKIDVQYQAEHRTVICYHNGESKRLSEMHNNDLIIKPIFLSNGTIDQKGFNSVVPHIIQWTRERHVARDKMEYDWDFLRKRRLCDFPSVDSLELDRKGRLVGVRDVDIEDVIDLSERKERKR